jgi:hypothetical protein
MMIAGRSREGQALIEFLLGLVAIMILVLGINLIAGTVYNDFITIYSAREEVADSLVSESAGTSGGSSTYDFSTLKQEFTDALNPSGTLESKLDEYPGDRENQFDFLWEGDDPLEDLVGSQITSTTPITSPFFQKILGRNSVVIQNAIYMPPWHDLME